MKTQLTLIFSIALLAFAFSACSFSTANISSLNFGKNETAKPPATSFNVGERIYAVSTASNAMGKHKVKFNLKYENVSGKTKGESAAKTEVDIDGDSEAFMFFNAALPGEYGVEVVLVDEQGKEIDKKSGTVSVKGIAPAEQKSDDASNQDSEEKPSN